MCVLTKTITCYNLPAKHLNNINDTSVNWKV